ncbi:hypothetical protein [Magnetovibrio sp.]|uniref:hypothetical protein n=1 Tax=Magnetovibrio sp. TaxID=2024836 RepID=UPI002F95FB85
MDAKTRNLNDAMLMQSMLIAKYFPLHRKLKIADEFRAAAHELRHHGLALQAGQIDGDPRDFLKLALEACADRGVCAADIATIVNDHQRGHAGPMRKAVGDGA